MFFVKIVCEAFAAMYLLLLNNFALILKNGSSINVVVTMAIVNVVIKNNVSPIAVYPNICTKNKTKTGCHKYQL